MSSNKQIDLSGLNCPLPILRAKKALAEMQSGQVLAVIATDPAAPQDFEVFCRQTGHVLLSSVIREDGKFCMVVKRK